MAKLSVSNFLSLGMMRGGDSTSATEPVKISPAGWRIYCVAIQ